MKYLILLPLFTLVSFSSNAQLEIDRIERQLLDKKDSIGISDYKWFVNLSGDFNTNSNSISNSFINALAYQRTFIDEQLKDNESRRLKKNNRFGLDANASLQGEFKGEKMSVLFGFGQRVFAAAKFPSDLFETVFRGNSNYAGETLNFSKTNFRYFDYQNYFLGLKKELKGGNLIVGGTAAYLRGGRFQSFEMNNTTFYTEPLGQYITLDGDLNYTRNDKDSKKKSHGNGASINLFLSFKQKMNRINFEVRDIGFMRWSELKKYEGNSTFTYNGLFISDVLNANSSILNSFTLDSIAAATGINISKGSTTTMLLPITFHANYCMMPNKKFTRTIGLKYIAAPGYIPKVYLRETDFLGYGFSLVNTFSYGGFGRLDYELGLMKKIKNSCIISLNLFAFEYLVLPQKSSGNGVNIGVIALF